MKKAVAYLRVSTESQVREGISLEAQRAKIEAWATVHDHELICIEEDAGISGKDIRNREGLQRAIEVACDEQAILIVYSLSRLSRSTRDTLGLVERLDSAGADLVSLSGIRSQRGLLVSSSTRRRSGKYIVLLLTAL